MCFGGLLHPSDSSPCTLQFSTLMASENRISRLLLKVLMWFVTLFTIDTACTLWLWHEPYSLLRTLGYSLFVAWVFALLDHFFNPFAGRSRNPN